MTPTKLFIDFETTGLSADRHAPISLAALILGGPNDGTVFQARMRPHMGAEVDAWALQINGYTFSQLMTFSLPSDVFADFADFLQRTHPDKTLITPVGHNIKFDEAFMRAWFTRHGSPDLYGFTFGPSECTIDILKTTWPTHAGTHWPKKGGLKLTFQYEWHFGEQYADAHTELADVYATRALYLLADRHSGRNHFADYHHYIPNTVTR